MDFISWSEVLKIGTLMVVAAICVLVVSEGTKF